MTRQERENRERSRRWAGYAFRESADLSEQDVFLGRGRAVVGEPAGKRIVMGTGEVIGQVDGLCKPVQASA